MGMLGIRGVMAATIALGICTSAHVARAEAPNKAPVRTALAEPDADALLRLGRDAASRGALDQALGFFQRAVALAPRRPETLEGLAGTLTDLERWEDARQAFERLLRAAPEDANALNGLGYVHYRQDRLDSAIACYRRALSRREDPQFHLNLGLAYLGQGRWGQAEDEFTRTLELAPDDYWAFNNRAYALEQQGRVREAADSYQGAIDVAKKDEVTAHLNYGGLLLDNKEPESAAWIFREALKLNDKSADAHLGFASALNQMGAQDQAYLEVRAALSLDADNATAHHLLAELYRQRRQPRQALAEVRRAIALQADMPAFQLSLGRLLEGEGRTDEAMAAYQKFLKLAPDDADSEDVALQVRVWKETRQGP